MRKQEKNDEKRNSINRTVSIILGLSICCGALVYGAKKIEVAYPTSAFLQNKSPVIVIDAGHGECF